MKDDLEAKTLEALKERKQQLTHQINVMDQMRVRQIDTAVNAAGDAARELTSERRIAIHANINPYFLPALDDLHNQLAAVQSEFIGSVRIKTVFDSTLSHCPVIRSTAKKFDR